MDVRSNQAYYAFVYDPYLYGFNTAYWKELNGTATTLANRIRLNSLAIVSKHQYLRGKFTFGIQMPAAPSVGQNKEFGLKSPSIATARNAAYFQILGPVVNAITVGPTGVVTTTPLDQTAIDAVTWTTNNDFSIFWQRNRVVFAINGVTVADINDRNLVPQNSVLPIHIANNNADNEDIAYVELNYVDQVVDQPFELPVVSPNGTVNLTIESVGENITATDVVSGINVSPAASVSDAVSVAESVTLNQISIFPSVNETTTVTESVELEVS